MTLLVLLFVLWIAVMSVVIYLFCGAAREFVSSPEMELLPLKQDGSARHPEDGFN